MNDETKYVMKTVVAGHKTEKAYFYFSDAARAL